MRTPGRFFLILVVLFSATMVGCRDRDSGEPAAQASASQDARPQEVWTLSDDPLLEIGVRAGEDHYELHNAWGSVRLDDGRIVVANAGSQELRFYDEEGSFLSSVGQNGEGPGEFRNPSRLRKAGGDTLLVWDERLWRISYFNPEGEFLGASQVRRNSDLDFPLDEWLFQRFFIDSPIPYDAREPIRSAVRTIPPPHPTVGAAFLKVTQEGRIWASEVRPPADTAVTWTVYDLDGRPVARASTPSGFAPHEIGHDYVLGLSRDELDVNYIRLYALDKPAGSPQGPGLDSSQEAPEAAEPPPRAPRSAEEEEALGPVKMLMKNLASFEEIHYADNYSYTANVGELFSGADVEAPEGISVTILFANRQAWAATVTHLETGVFCALAFGRPAPMGWAPGVIICP
jgi:hypothetical protein